MPITALPTPPSRQDPANFPARADAFHAALPTFATEATALEQNVNTKEASAVAKAAAAATSEANALASKSAAAASEANALAYKNSADASKTAAETAKDTAVAQAGLAAASAASAASVLQQDLSAVAAAALHRSPNAIAALFIYDTSKDSDGGAWTERMQHTSWYNEALNGAWLGQHASEAAARAATGAATGAYFQLTTDGKFYKLLAGAGTAEVFRGNKAKFPRLAAIVAEAASVTIYDLTEAGRPMWMVLRTGYHYWDGNSSSALSLYALNGVLCIGHNPNQVGWSGEGLYVLDFPRSKTSANTTGSNPDFSPIRSDNFTSTKSAVASATQRADRQYTLPNYVVNAVAMTVLPDAPIDVATGLAVPTIHVATAGGWSVIQHDGSVANYFETLDFVGIAVSGNLATATRNGGSGTRQATVRGLMPNNFTMNVFHTNGASGQSNQGPALLTNTIIEVAPAGRDRLVTGGVVGVSIVQENAGAASKGVVGYITGSYNTGHMPGDIRRAYLADAVVGNVSNPATVADRSYKAASATVYGTLARTAVAAAAQLVAYSGFGAANYLREPYSADLDFGTGEWSTSAWVSYSTAVASTIAERGAATGPSIKLGTDATGKLVATAYDGTTTRTVTTSVAYNTGTWTKVAAIYKTDGSLAIDVNGVEVVKTTGAPLLTLNNAAAVLTIGNSRALDAPFPGSLALAKLGATVPTAEQSAWMYEQEKQIFRDGAQCCLPDSGAIADLAYDEAQDKWVVVSAANESHWTGLVRTASAPVSAGAITKVSAQSGVKLLARSTTSPGVDVSIPAYGLREELVKRAEKAAQIAKNITVFDFDAVTAQTDFVLPAGYTARAVLSAGALKREGSTKDYTRLFDGFRETIRFGVAPGNGVWVQIHAVKE